jgi:dTDP-4-amino-4,6-dideoxygalactose transaminase
LESLQDRISLPFIPEYATNNAHMFYIRCSNLDERMSLIYYLKQHGITAVFHYQSLHRSPYYQGKHDGRSLPVTDQLSDTLLRLPLFFELTEEQVLFISKKIKEFYQ